MSVLGTRVLRTEDPRFLTEGGRYVEDLRDPALAGAAYVTYVRSALAHARITVDVGPAREAPGVVAAFRAEDLDLADLAPSFDLPASMPRPWLARDVVRYVGEPVAVVVTEWPYQGEDAAELVVVDYDPLPVVATVQDAARDETLLFPEAGTNSTGTLKLGSVEGIFDGCDVVVHQQVVNQRLAPAPLEVRGTAAVWADRLTVWSSTQHAQGARDRFAQCLDLDPTAVRVIAPDVGGGFGAKIEAGPEELLVAELARRLGRPMRWTETRTENMQSMGHGRAQYQTVTIGGRRDGTVLAYHLDVLQDAGAYPSLGAFLPFLTRMMTGGSYRIPQIAFTSRTVVTNTASTVAYRGAGRPEATAAIERAMDLFAREIDMDPVEVRRRNLLTSDAFPFTTASGATYDTGDYIGALERVCAGAGYDALRTEQAHRRTAGDVRQLGIGVSTYVEVTAGPVAEKENARVDVRPDGEVIVYTGTSPHGQGHETSWAMIASAELGVPLERVRVVHGDTDLIGSGGGTMGSRSLQVGGAAVQQAAIAVVEQARALAADLFEAAPGDVVLDKERGVFHIAGSPGETRSWGQVAAAADETDGLIVHEEFQASQPTFPFGAHLAVVEVDTETGGVRLIRMVTVDDAGRLINPVVVEGQRHGGIAQGAAQALLEEMAYDSEGNPVTGNLGDYGFITAAELPSIELLVMETPTPVNPLGAKGIGESGTIGSAPAVQSAVVDALAHLGVRHVDMPCTAERVWTAIRQAHQVDGGTQ